MRPNYVMIAACGKNREIIRNDSTLLRAPADNEFFYTTIGGLEAIPCHSGWKIVEPEPWVVVGKYASMDNKMMENILHRNTNTHIFVICHNKPYDFWMSNSVTYLTKEEFDQKAQKHDGIIYIIGGESIYRQFMDVTNTLYLTIYDKDFPDADAFFPEYKDKFKPGEKISVGTYKNEVYRILKFRSKYL